MKFKTLALAAALIVTPNAYAIKKTAPKKHHQESPAVEPISGIDRCIIVTGLICCLPCAAIEQCCKKVFPNFKAS